MSTQTIPDPTPAPIPDPTPVDLNAALDQALTVLADARANYAHQTAAITAAQTGVTSAEENLATANATLADAQASSTADAGALRKALDAVDAAIVALELTLPTQPAA